jgi:hypothetical protein
MKAAMKEITSSHEKKLESKDVEIAALKKKISDTAPKPVAETAEAPAKELTEEDRIAKLEDETFSKALKKRRRVAKIGGKLSKKMIEDLGLDENQVANVNDVLKNEGERMTERLREFATTILDGTTVEDFGNMNGTEISIKLQSHFMDDLKQLATASEEDRVAFSTGDKSFIKFLPKDSNLVKITKFFYNERMETYDELAVHMDEETLSKFKKEYLGSGTFVFPGGANYGMGEIDPADFEE